MANHRKEATASKLKKFFTTMTQAKNLWATSDGINPYNLIFPDDAVSVGDKTLEFYNKSFGKYLSSTKAEVVGNYIRVHFNDGTSFVARIASNTVMYFFFCMQNECYSEVFDGRKSFLFTMNNNGFSPGNGSVIMCKKRPPANRFDFGKYVRVGIACSVHYNARL